MKMRLLVMGFVVTVMMYIEYRMTNYQHKHTEMEDILDPFDAEKHALSGGGKLGQLPRGIIVTQSDLEMKPLWREGPAGVEGRHSLLAIPAGIKQKGNIDKMVSKFLGANFTVILFHYDSSLESWSKEVSWSEEVIHVVAHNQTKWWFAKRFLHPDVVSSYEYLFLWDEDLGVDSFHPGRYLEVVRAGGLEISQPALDPANSTVIHHRITIRARGGGRDFHTRVYEHRGSTRCDDASTGPPCTGFVEGMAPVFSRSAWYCAWHLIQNDLVHGWGLDMSLGYCAQGDRSRKVGVVDTEFVVHQGIQTLGTTSTSSNSNSKQLDVRMEIRRQSSWEFRRFKERWKRAVIEDKLWTDPFTATSFYKKQRRSSS